MSEQTIPPLTCLYFYLTEGCNLRCRHCWINPPYEPMEPIHPCISPELFRDIIGQAAEIGLEAVKLTGGEPLLNPDIRGILEEIRSAGLRLIVETNATLCTPELAAAMAGAKHPFVSVSIDSPLAAEHEWVRGVPGCFDAALEGIRQLREAGIRPQIIMSVMRRNCGRIGELIRFAIEHGAGSVKLNPVVATARGEQIEREQGLLSIEELIRLGEKVVGEFALNSPIPVIFSQPPAFSPLSAVCSGCQGGNCNIFNILGVLGSGRYALCGIGETVPEMVFADARRTPLVEVWREHPVLRRLRRDLPDALEGVCAACVMRERCLGYCVAHTYHASGRLTAPNRFCQQAFEAGLFPPGRLRPRN